MSAVADGLGRLGQRGGDDAADGAIRFCPAAGEDVGAQVYDQDVIMFRACCGFVHWLPQAGYTEQVASPRFSTMPLAEALR